MGFDEIPENQKETWPCPDCGGVVEYEEGFWICTEPGSCTWSAEEEGGKP